MMSTTHITHHMHTHTHIPSNGFFFFFFFFSSLLSFLSLSRSLILQAIVYSHIHTDKLVTATTKRDSNCCRIIRIVCSSWLFFSSSFSWFHRESFVLFLYFKDKKKSKFFGFFHRSRLCACRFFYMCRACLAARVTLTNRAQLLLSLSINKFGIA